MGANADQGSEMEPRTEMDAELQQACAALQSQGWCVLPGVLSAAEAADVRGILVESAAAYADAGGETYMPELDPNDRNIRVFNLLDLHQRFRELILHPVAVQLVSCLLGEHFRISNFTANIALPGSGSMAMHSDLAFVAPPPWREPWSINIIWALDDVTEDNGGTRYLPDSHQFETINDVPPDPMSHSVAFEAPRGAVIAMDGRMWHTSGANITADQQRALLFGYYSVDFIRPQVNWNAVLSPETQAGLSTELQQRLVLGPSSNVRYAGEIMAADVARLRPDLYPSDS